MATTTQYILTGIAAAGIAFWYDFKSWQNFGSQYDPFFENYRLTKFRNWRHTANIARISKDPTMGSLPTLQAPKSTGRITHPRHRDLIYQASKSP
jgi:hypothetical protein